MRFRVIGKRASSNGKAGADGGRTVPLAAAEAKSAVPATVYADADHNCTENGSKDESFFETRPWLDSDSEDDFYSVRGDFTPSRGSTPDHQRLRSFNGRTVVDRLKPSLTEKKQRLIELLQEKQQYDDEDDSVTDVHTKEHLKPSCKGDEVKKSPKSGCFPSLTWKRSFKICRKKRKEQKDK
ncbi:uncharacterized protein LOC133887805 [Phragmites australis]|uniref:uncharacterized protein LOC133887805 n=1 Tax=Phragmites australis TaxID=29695 RepID=UPI002D78DBC3|nr:uncharacterized protein LOC133887805 [Phragmites australis]